MIQITNSILQRQEFAPQVLILVNKYGTIQIFDNNHEDVRIGSTGYNFLPGTFSCFWPLL